MLGIGLWLDLYLAENEVTASYMSSLFFAELESGRGGKVGVAEKWSWLESRPSWKLGLAGSLPSCKIGLAGNRS